MTEKDLAEFNEKTVAKVNEMTYMSDLFMSYAFKDIEVQKHIIRTCMDDSSIELISTDTQVRFNNINGKEVVFDSVSVDTKGNVYNVEVENDKKRGGLKRNMFHVGALCTQFVPKGLKDYQDIPVVNGIMLVRGDALGNGKQKTVFEVRNTHHPDKTVKDAIFRNTIIDVLNTDEKNALSQLNLDTQQEDYRNIQNEALARRMKEIKEGEEFIEMCEVLESYRNEGFEEGKVAGKIDGISEGDENRSREVALKLMNLNWSLTMISEFLERDIEEIESWAKESGIPYYIN